MIEYGWNKGLKGFTADILPSNHKMIGLLKKAVGNVSVQREEGTLEMTVQF